MAVNEVYNLRWNDYSTTLSSCVGTLLDDSDFIDVTLACEGQSFSAHKIVLSSCSGYLKKLLKRNPCQHPIVILKDVRANVLNSLVQFMYHGAVDVPEDQLSDFLNAAQSLEVKGLAEDDPQSLPPVKQAPRHDLGPPPKRARVVNTGSISSNIRSEVRIPRTTIVPSERVRSRSAVSPEVPSTVIRDSLQGTDVMGRIHSGEISITPSEQAADMNERGGIHDDQNKDDVLVKQEEYESDLEILEQEQSLKAEADNSMLSAAGSEDYSTSFAGQLPIEYQPEDSPGTSQSMAEGASSGLWKPTVREGFECGYCRRLFNTRQDLDRHVKRRHEVRPLEEWDPCHICGKTFKTRNCLNVHLIQTHGIYKRKPSFDTIP